MNRVDPKSRIPLDDGSCVMIDQTDWNNATRYTWHLVEVGGRLRIVALESLIPTNEPPLFLTRLITEALPGDLVVALNGNVRDCRRNNLAILSVRELAQLDTTQQLTAI